MRTALRTQPALVVGKQLPKLFPCDSPSRGNVFFLRLFLRVKVIPGFENVNLYFWYLFYSWLSPFSSLFSKFRMDNFVTGAWCVREKCFISTRRLKTVRDNLSLCIVCSKQSISSWIQFMIRVERGFHIKRLNLWNDHNVQHLVDLTYCLTTINESKNTL